MVSSETLIFSFAPGAVLGGGPVGAGSWTLALEYELDALLAVGVVAVLVVVVVMELLMIPAGAVARSGPMPES
jgi:hypothetical protein